MIITLKKSVVSHIPFSVLKEEQARYFLLPFY